MQNINATRRRTISAIASVAAVFASMITLTGTPAAASPLNGFSGSCATASGGEYWWTGLNWSEFVDKDQVYFGVGYRVTQLDIDGNGITAVWRPGSGTQWIRWNMSLDSFKSWDTYYFNQGLRLVDVDRDGDSWAAVWRPGTGEQRWRSGMSSWLDFKNQDQVYFNAGLRLADVIIESDSNIFAVWRADLGNSGQLWQSGILAIGADSNNESEFQRINRQRRQAGWELRILKTHPNDQYVFAVWRYRGGSFSQNTINSDTLAYFDTWESNCRALGMRIVTIDVK